MGVINWKNYDYLIYGQTPSKVKTVQVDPSNHFYLFKPASELSNSY